MARAARERSEQEREVMAERREGAPIRARSEREAAEYAPRPLAARESPLDAVNAFVEWAVTEWGEPTEAEAARAEEIWSNR